LDAALAFVPDALRHASTERPYRRFLKAEGRLEETKPQGPVEQLLLRYREYLRDVRGLAPATIDQHLVTIELFLCLSGGPSQDLSALTSEHVENFIQILSRRVLRQTLQHKVAPSARFSAFLRRSW